MQHAERLLVKAGVLVGAILLCVTGIAVGKIVKDITKSLKK